MAHDHHHHHDSGYFMEQLFAIGCCGLVGGIAVLLYTQGTVSTILAERFAIPLLLSGVAMLALALIRGIAVWQLAGQTAKKDHKHDHDHANCDHDHEHGACGHEHHDHGHHHHEEVKKEGVTAQPSLVPLGMAPVAAAEHKHHDHSHDHGHDHDHDHDHGHGWVPVRYLILLVLVLFWYFIPPGLVAQQYRAPKLDELETPTNFKRSGQKPIPDLSFLRLERAAYKAEDREELEGREVTVTGQFTPIAGDDKRFGMTRYKLNCCVADAIPLNCLVMVDPGWTGKGLNMNDRYGKWVTVRARVAFLKKKNTLREEYVTALIVEPDKEHSPDDLVQILDSPPRNQYLQ